MCHVTALQRARRTYQVIVRESLLIQWRRMKTIYVLLVCLPKGTWFGS